MSSSQMKHHSAGSEGPKVALSGDFELSHALLKMVINNSIGRYTQDLIRRPEFLVTSPEDFCSDGGKLDELNEYSWEYLQILKVVDYEWLACSIMDKQILDPNAFRVTIPPELVKPLFRANKRLKSENDEVPTMVVAADGFGVAMDAADMFWEDGRYEICRRVYREMGDRFDYRGKAGKKRKPTREISSMTKGFFDQQLINPIHRLMALIFNKQMFEDWMSLLEYDAKKHPVSKLPIHIIQQARDTLRDWTSPAEDFYSLIPGCMYRPDEDDSTNEPRFYQLDELIYVKTTDELMRLAEHGGLVDDITETHIQTDEDVPTTLENDTNSPTVQREDNEDKTVTAHQVKQEIDELEGPSSINIVEQQGHKELETPLAADVAKDTTGQEGSEVDAADYENLFDKQVATLGLAELTHLEVDSAEFQLLEERIRSTHFSSHYLTFKKIDSIYRVKRPDITANDPPAESRRLLLFHSPHPAKIPAILAKGFSLMPEEGRETWFSDTSCKAVCDSYYRRMNNLAVVMLCEVPLESNESGPMLQLNDHGEDEEIWEKLRELHGLAVMKKGRMNPPLCDAGDVNPELAGVLMPVRESSQPMPKEVIRNFQQFNEYISVRADLVKPRYIICVTVERQKATLVDNELTDDHDWSEVDNAVRDRALEEQRKKKEEARLKKEQWHAVRNRNKELRAQGLPVPRKRKAKAGGMLADSVPEEGEKGRKKAKVEGEPSTKGMKVKKEEE
ncbi:hypothetical protein ACLMJK_002883 [Lecanora helva]